MSFLNFFSRNSNSSSVAESNTVVDSVKVGNNSVISENHEGDCVHETETEAVEISQKPQDLSSELGYEEVSSDHCEEFCDYQQSPKTVSYALKPLLYTAKYGAKALSATTIIGSYTLNGASYVIAGMSYVPYGASKMLEEIKEEDKNTVNYKVINTSQNLLNLTSGAMYAISYVPHGAGVVLNEVSGIANQLDSSLSPEKIEQICTKSDLFVEDLSSRLKEVKNSSAEAMSGFSNVLTKAEKQNSTDKTAKDISKSKELLESDISKSDMPSTKLSILSNISRVFSAPFSYLAS